MTRPTPSLRFEYGDGITDRVPRDTVIALERLILDPKGWRRSMAMLDSVRFLIESWEDNRLQSALRSDTSRGGIEVFELADGTFAVRQVPGATRVARIPRASWASVVSALEVDALPARGRALRMISLLNDWEDLLLDTEKLAGHMLLIHGIGDTKLNHNSLHAAHRVAHVRRVPLIPAAKRSSVGFV